MEMEPGYLLVISDNSVDGEALSRQIEQLGYRLASAGDERHALEMLASQPFDLVLLDMRRPALDPSVILEHIRSRNGSGPVPVIALTEAGDLEGLEALLALGIEDYLREPVTPRLLKARVDRGLEKRRLLAQAVQQKDFVKYEQELQIGRQMQRSFLPDTLPQPAGWEIAACFQPARQVAGDFYDAFALPRNRVGLVIGDVCDKGVSAALFMTLFRSLIRAFAQQHYTLGQLDRLSSRPSAPRSTAGARRQALPGIGTQALKNAIVLTNNYIAGTHADSNMFATIFFGVLDPATGIMIYINGGHERPAIVGPTGVKARLDPTGPAVGMMPDMDFEIEQVQLDPGDVLITYTDGVPEAKNPAGKLFTEKNLLAVLAEPAPSAVGLLDRIEGTVRAHIAGAVQFDDITMLAVRRAVETQK
jgi:sigma-B regulation protein RsbU (phosphoserine phosphatase)